MRYYSTRNTKLQHTLVQAVVNGLAPDGGLYLPDRIVRLPRAFFNNVSQMSLHELAYSVANVAFQGDVNARTLNRIVCDTLSFDIPLVEVAPDRYVLELFHGPTMAFKDIGARFMARLMGHFMRQGHIRTRVTVLVPTSGDTGSAVANGFGSIEGIDVVVLFPRGEVNDIQVSQFATLGPNVTAVEVNGTFDDCRRLVAQAFADEDLKHRRLLTSATTINVSRLMAQTFYYFHAIAQLRRQRPDDDRPVVISVPCANLGNLASGLLSYQMGLPVSRFVSVENSNNIFYNYVMTGQFVPRSSTPSIAPGLDAGNPTNFERLPILAGGLEGIRRMVHARFYDDEELVKTMSESYHALRYLMDPHTAAAYRGLVDDLREGEVGIALGTAHPAKLLRTVERIVGHELVVPPQLSRFTSAPRRIESLPSGYAAFRRWLLQ